MGSAQAASSVGSKSAHSTSGARSYASQGYSASAYDVASERDDRFGVESYGDRDYDNSYSVAWSRYDDDDEEEERPIYSPGDLPRRGRGPRRGGGPRRRPPLGGPWGPPRGRYGGPPLGGPWGPPGGRHRMMSEVGGPFPPEGREFREGEGEAEKTAET